MRPQCKEELNRVHHVKFTSLCTVTATLFLLTDFKSHLFILYWLTETITRWTRGGKYLEKPPPNDKLKKKPLVFKWPKIQALIKTRIYIPALGAGLESRMLTLKPHIANMKPIRLSCWHWHWHQANHHQYCMFGAPNRTKCPGDKKVIGHSVLPMQQQ